MEGKQLMIWDKEYLNRVAPRMKSKREMKKEKRELLEKSLSVRNSLSDLEKDIYNYPLNKKDLVEFFDKKNFGGKGAYWNKGVPQMLLTTLSKYSEKDQKDLLVSDMKVLHKTLENIFPGYIGNLETRKFSKANNLRFGVTQYSFMDFYLENFD
jgi:hypothetical protein